MPVTKQFHLPDVGEGLAEAEIIEWRVGPGDPVGLNDVIVEIETAKAAVELPSPYAGIVSELLYSAGDTVAVGAPIVSISVEGDSTPGHRRPRSRPQKTTHRCPSRNSRPCRLVSRCWSATAPRTYGRHDRRARTGL